MVYDATAPHMTNPIGKKPAGYGLNPLPRQSSPQDPLADHFAPANREQLAFASPALFFLEASAALWRIQDAVMHHKK